MIGPLVFTALFLPQNKHNEILLRYDLNYSFISKKESSHDIARYNRILSLNRSELGYLLKAIGPEEASNLMQAEGTSDAAMFTNLVMGVYRNFLKIIQKKLKFKIGDVSFRCNRFVYQGMWERLQFEFPKLSFKVC
jgi:hypothetical protein